jgi:hypothetical protein
MSRARALLVVMLLSTAACGGEPPDKEMQQAQGAIDAARAAGADVYAAEELAAARSALTRAEEAVAARDYRLALNHALDSRQRAQNAATLAADGKASARVEADKAVTAAAAAVDALRARLKAPDVARLPSRTLVVPRQAIADAERLVQEARTALERGDYASARSVATRATTDLATASRDLDAAAAANARRRR